MGTAMGIAGSGSLVRIVKGMVVSLVLGSGAY